MTKQKNVAIIGAGISGLSLAHFLSKSLGEKVQLKVFEGRNRPGGLMHTHSISNINDKGTKWKGGKGFLFEYGPRSFIHKRGERTLEMIRDLGLENEIIQPKKSAIKRFIFRNKRFEEVNLENFLKEFDKECLKRVLNNSFLRNPFYKAPKNQDLSIFNYFSSILGPEMAEYIETLLLGVFSGDAKQLSFKSCFPPLWDISVNKRFPLLSFLLQNMKRNKSSKANIFSFKNGCNTMPNKMVEFIESNKGKILTRTPVISLEFGRGKDKMKIFGDNKNSLGQFDLVISTVSAPQLGNILKMVENKSRELLDLIRSLKSIKHAPLITTNIAYRNGFTIPEKLKSFGFLVSPKENLPILGATFDSECFPQHNREESETRMTFMSGGLLRENDPEISAIYKSENILEVSKHAKKGLENKIIDFMKKYIYCKENGVKYKNFKNAQNGKVESFEVMNTEVKEIPQMNIGHKRNVEKMGNLASKISDKFYFSGWSFDGVSINRRVDASYQLCNRILKDHFGK